MIGLLVAVPLLARVVQRGVIVRLALVLTPVVLLPAATSLVAGVVVVGARLLAGPARLLLLVLPVRQFIIIICHIVSRRVLGLLAVVTLPVLVARVVLIALVLVALVLSIVSISLVPILVVGPLVGS